MFHRRPSAVVFKSPIAVDMVFLVLFISYMIFICIY